MDNSGNETVSEVENYLICFLQIASISLTIFFHCILEKQPRYYFCGQSKNMTKNSWSTYHIFESQLHYTLWSHYHRAEKILLNSECMCRYMYCFSIVLLHSPFLPNQPSIAHQIVFHDMGFHLNNWVYMYQRIKPFSQVQFLLSRKYQVQQQISLSSMLS